DVLAKVKPDETRPEVFALAVDPNKKMAATLSWFPSNNLPIPTLHVLNIGPGTEIFRISDVGVSKGSGYAVAISQNLEFVAAAYRRGEMHDTPTAKIWKLPEGKEHLAIVHQPWINGIAFSSKAAFVATAGVDRTARIWEMSTGRELAKLFHPYSVQ